MSHRTHFLVGAGELEATEMQAPCTVLAKAYGCKLDAQDCSSNPHDFLAQTSIGSSMTMLYGDAARTHSEGISWLEALGNWKKPVSLLVKPLITGEMPGSAAAYLALCEKLSVPVVGIIQVGGKWEPNLRRRDGLPWLGLIPERVVNKDGSDKVTSLSEADQIDRVTYQINKILGQK